MQFDDQFKDLYIRVVQDTLREVECYIFSEEPVSDEALDRLMVSHHVVLDMFLCRQPIIVVPDYMSTERSVGRVGVSAVLLLLEHLAPPYSEFLVNSHAMELLEGNSIPEKLSGLSEFSCGMLDKEHLLIFLKDLSTKGLYLVGIDV